MLLEPYTGVALSKIIEDLEEIYQESKKVSKNKDLLMDFARKGFDYAGGILMVFESIILLADYYIEEYDKGIESLKQGKPNRFFLDRLHDINNEASTSNEVLGKLKLEEYRRDDDLSALYNQLDGYTLTLCMLYLIYEPIEERYFFGNYDNDLKYKADKIVRDGNFLLYDGKKVEMNNKSREYKVIKYLFEQAIDKTVDFDEIDEFFDENSDFTSNDGSSYYHACRRINSKVAQEFRIDNFLKFDTRTVCINNLQE